jgi:hypothetical protein
LPSYNDTADRVYGWKAFNICKTTPYKVVLGALPCAQPSGLVALKLHRLDHNQRGDRRAQIHSPPHVDSVIDPINLPSLARKNWPSDHPSACISWDVPLGWQETRKRVLELRRPVPAARPGRRGNDDSPSLQVDDFAGLCAVSAVGLGKTGFDYVWLDTEHSALNPRALEQTMRTSRRPG